MLNFTDWKPEQCLFKKKILYSIDTDGKYSLDFKNSYMEQNWDGKDYFELPCSKCLYCMKRYSVQWAVRCVLESRLHTQNCFITLTYNEENVPSDGELKKRDYQLFLKKLRKHLGKKIRYFLAGEYGGQNLRPHFHAIIFGWCPDDLVFLKKDGKTKLYTSKVLEKIWGNGFVSVGVDMNIAAIKYTAKYLNKLQVIPPHYNQKPFIQASTKPGIGAFSYDKKYLEQNGIFVDGIKYSIPRYFIKLANKNGDDLAIDNLKNYQKDILDKVKYTDDEKLQQIRNYFVYVNEQKIGFNHLYDLKRYDLLEINKNVRSELKELENVLY